MSRYSKYKVLKRDLKKAYSLKRKGLTDRKIAKGIGISLSTYQIYKNVFVRFFRIQDFGRKKPLPVGRPKYSQLREKVTPEILTALAIIGYPKTKIANILGINLSTLYYLVDRFPELDDALTNGVEHTNRRIINALVARAEGYEHDAVHISAYQGEVVQTPITKKYPPDSQALAMYLVNMMGWKKEPDSNGHNSKGKIIEALDEMNKLDEGE